MPLIHDPDRFSKIASGIQAIVISVAVVVGGGWTLYAFNAQLQVENAQAQLEKIKREIAAEAKVELTISLQQINSAVKNRKTIVGTINMRNVGSTTLLQMEREPVKLYAVSFDEYGREQWTLLRKISLRVTEQLPLTTLFSHAGFVQSRQFVTEVDKLGLYAVKFSAPRREEERAIAYIHEPNLPPMAVVEWGNHTYIFVK